MRYNDHLLCILLMATETPLITITDEKITFDPKDLIFYPNIGDSCPYEHAIEEFTYYDTLAKKIVSQADKKSYWRSTYPRKTIREMNDILIEFHQMPKGTLCAFDMDRFGMYNAFIVIDHQPEVIKAIFPRMRLVNNQNKQEIISSDSDSSSQDEDDDDIDQDCHQADGRYHRPKLSKFRNSDVEFGQDQLVERKYVEELRDTFEKKYGKLCKCIFATGYSQCSCFERPFSKYFKESFEPRDSKFEYTIGLIDMNQVNEYQFISILNKTEIELYELQCPLSLNF